MDREIWKDVVGYEGLYQVSNFGNVKRTFILKPHIDRKGYYFVNLSMNGKVKCVRVHQLVGKAFIDNPYSKKEINHKNGNKLDNRVENLEWVSHKENMEHAYRNKLISPNCFKKCVLCAKEKNRKPISQIESGIVIAIYESISQAQRQTGIKHISCAATGKRKTAGGYEWKYLDKKSGLSHSYIL